MMTTSVATETWTKHTFGAMGTHVTVSARTRSQEVVQRDVELLFGRVERSCSRFDPQSDLSRVNAEPDTEHVVTRECFEVTRAAHRAHLETDGLFDPRILTSLVAAGYDRTFDELSPTTDSEDADASVDLHSPWQPRFDAHAHRIEIGERPIDLGGIGKGWTVDVAAALVAEGASDFLVNAGGDLTVRGQGPTGDGWTVGIEDPRDLTLTTAVLRLHDASCATSSTARRLWRAGDRVNHHLIDPRTGRPAAGGLSSVTVVAESAARAETWSKALLIGGSDDIAELAADRQIAAYWVLDDGRTGFSSPMSAFVAWERG